MNKQDVERYEALYRDTFQTRLDLDALAACPQGHPFTVGFEEEGGRVGKIKLRVNVTPKGRVTCLDCDAQRQQSQRDALKRYQLRQHSGAGPAEPAGRG